MNVKEFIERLKDFNQEDEILIGGFPINYSDIGVSDRPNSVSVFFGFKDMDDIISDIKESIYDIDSEILLLEDDGVDTIELETAVDSLRSLVEDLYDLEY